MTRAFLHGSSCPSIAECSARSTAPESAGARNGALDNIAVVCVVCYDSAPI